mgnify:CR=1 FL=1
MVNEMKKKLLVGALSVVPLSMLIYWFNLDNKLLFYVIRPLLNKLYNKQKRDVKL